MDPLSPVAFRDALDRRGIQRFTGVPCSYFGGLIQILEKDCYLAAANEGAAFATACGLALAGERAAVMIQNSGLGNLVNPLTSLSAVYDLGVLMLVSHRGDPGGAPDEPQHRVMGAATEPLLDTLDVPHWRLTNRLDELEPVLDAAMAELSRGRSAAIVVGKGVIGPAAPEALADSPRPAPTEVLRVIAERITDELVVATTGYTSRRLFAARDRPANFYMQGSMGHASSIGLGVALADPGSRVVVLDGDGACLMHLGALSTIGASSPANLVHIVLDNGRYESTGGQWVAPVRYDAVALATGYRRAARATTLDEVETGLEDLLTGPGPAMLVIEVGAGGTAPPRATESLSATAIRARFMAQSGRSAEGTPR